MAKLPIKFSELLQLPRLGIQQNSISFSFLTMESEKYICVREKVEEQNQVVIITVANPTQPMRRPISADSAIMNPNRYQLALSAGQQLQVFDLEGRAKLADQTMREPVVFWHWVNDTTIGLVTQGSVYHWNIAQQGSQPVKMFDRLRELAESQIIGYRTDADCKWLALIGIAQREGQVVGNIQLHSVDKGASQFIEGHAAAFARFYVQTDTGAIASKPSTIFVFAQRTAAASKLFLLEVARGDEDKPFPRTAVDVFYPPDAAGDFPVSIQVSEKYDMAFLITKFGYLHMFHLASGALVYRNRISTETIFVTAPQASTDGVVCVNRKGQVLAVSVDDQTVVGYVLTTLNDVALAVRIAGKNNLPGAEGLFTEQFGRLLAAGQLKEAAALAFRSPGTLLRNSQTIARLQQLQPPPGQPSPLLVYFGTLLDLGKLNQLESLELARVVLSQNRVQLLERWLQENKFECSEAMGELVRPVNPTLALQIFYLANASAKVVQLLAETGQQDKIAAYCSKTGYSADFKGVLASMLPGNPAGARAYAANILKTDKKVDISVVIDEFLRYNLVQDLTSLLLDVLKEDRPDQGPYQTRLLEINLVQAPQVAEAILGNDMFHHYNRLRIGQLCEQAGLFQRALEHYTELADIKRIMLHAPAINPEFLVGFFAQRSVEETLELMQDLLRSPAGPRQNLQVVVQIAAKYSAQLTPTNVLALFEKFKAYDGMYYYLNSIVNASEDPEVHYKYIEAACRVGQFSEVERMARESNHYDPARVRDLLKEAKLQDQLPLIIVCDRFGFVEDLTKHLYQHNLSRYIEAYVQKINPAQTPAVVGALLDAGCNEEYIKALVISVRGGCPVDKLVEAVSTRNRLKLILPWLEQRSTEGNIEPALHNALAMCYVDLSRNAEEFLNENMHYDARVVGKYTESRDPYLAFVAYRHGKCDDELLAVANSHALYKHEARYLVQRQDPVLWNRVLTDPAFAEHRRAIVDQVVQSALPETTDPEEIKSTVKAFMAADMPAELIELLEHIVLDGRRPEFATNKDLQNLLILTAVKVAPERVMDFVTRLDGYEAPDIANICISAGLFEEALVIFKKFKHNVAAIQVLIEHLKDLKRAREFAEKCNEPEVYSRLAKAQLDGGEVRDAIASFLKANDHEFFAEVISAAEAAGAFDDLVKYLQMARKKVKDAAIESELLFAFAKTNKMPEIEDFIASPNCAQIQQVGDRCFNEGLFEAAKLLFASINNFVRLASTLVRLHDFAAAVDAARKANSTTTWRDVTVACLDAREFKLAQASALNIIVHSDEIAECVSQYERRGFFDEAMQMLEVGITLERAHPGMYTELAVQYSKHREDKLMDFLRLNTAKLVPAKVIRICRENQQWKELTFMYLAGEDFDHAVETMIDHGCDAWDHVQFRDALAKSTKQDLLYRSVDFYLSEHPGRVNELLQSLVARYDHPTVVERARRRGCVALIKPYLVLVQKDNDVAAVNEALNQLYIEENDHESLRKSIDTRSQFDQNALAKQLETHRQLEFRRIAASVYAKNKRFEDAIELSKKDELWADAMDSAAKSGNRELAEGLLGFFVGKGLKPCFVACLYSCYDLLRPDVVLELGWRNGLVELIVPFMVQTIRETGARIEALEQKEQAREKAEKERAQKQASASPFDQVAGAAAAGPGGFGMLALPAPPVEVPVVAQMPLPPGMMAAPGMMPVPGMMAPGMMPAVPGMMAPGMLPMPDSGLPPMSGSGFMGIQ